MKLYLALLFTFATATTIASRKIGRASYEVWGCDQSNTVPGLDALGVQGSFLWIWDSNDVKEVIKTGVTPLSKPCTPDAKSGPCDLLQMFPGTLLDSVSNQALSESEGFGRWHGVTVDPQNRYVIANIFAPNGGYIGIVDVETRGAVGLFRATLTTFDVGSDTNKTTRNVHMSFWNHDGSAIIIHNLAGKAVERINVERDGEEKITGLNFDKSATVGIGKGMKVAAEASFFIGKNAFGESLLGGVVGSYDDADLGDLISATAECKEDGCSSVDADNSAASSPGRPNNLPICPVISPNGLIFNTLAGGGVLVMDSKDTPMSVVASYPNSKIYGAGVCGEAVGDKIYFTSGNSASGAGTTQSMWALFAFDSSNFDRNNTNPDPSFKFEFPGTATGGRVEGDPTNESGQIPGISTRRDAHDLAGTVDGKYVHVIDRIQDVLDVFDTNTDEHVGTYSLRTKSGAIDDNEAGACNDASVTDGGDEFDVNNPTSDFISPTPDGKYMMLSTRGPAPVSAGHSAQGSCPGVGIVELKDGGTSGALVGVFRSVNTIPDNLEIISPAGGVPYSGKERSDVHDVVVIKKSDSNGISYSGDMESISHSAAPSYVIGRVLIGLIISSALIAIYV
jgi:hypothetical protein